MNSIFSDPGRRVTGVNGNKQGHAAFEAAVVSSSRYIYSLSYRLTGSHDDASDLMQETYLKAFQKWDSARNRDNPMPWLRKICLNAFIDAGRKTGARGRMKETVFPAEEHDIVSDRPSPEDEVLADEEVRRIQSQCYTLMTTMLGLYQRIAFVLIDIFQLEIGEVSRLLRRSEASTKSLLYRARNRMNGAIGSSCGILNPEHHCRCRSWIAFSHDIEQRRRRLREIISRAGDAGHESGEKLHALYAALPHLNPPPHCLDDIILKLK